MKRAENPRRFRVLAGLVLLMTAAAVGNVDPRKGRVTQNPTGGNRYSIEQEVQYRAAGHSGDHLSERRSQYRFGGLRNH